MYQTSVEGDYEISVDIPGYRPQRQTVKLATGAGMGLNFAKMLQFTMERIQ
jgi:hypothetical protein